MPVRDAAPDEFVSVMRILEGALLEVDAEDVRQALRSDTDSRVLLAERDDRPVGALLLDESHAESGAHIEAIAVTRSRRGDGIGRTLVAAADDRLPADASLTADFDENVRPFYESLGFEIEERDGRLWGRR